MKTVDTTATPTTFTLPAREILAAHCFTCNEQVRYYLNHVFIDTRDTPDYVQLVGVEGAVAGVFQAPDAVVGAECATQADGFLLSVDITEKAFKAKTKGDLWVHGDVTTGILQFFDSETNARVGVCEFSRHDGTFPDWRRVMPTVGEPKAALCFNPDLLLRFKKAQDIFGKGGALRVVSGNSETDPITVEMSEFRSFKGVIMPVRWSTVCA